MDHESVQGVSARGAGGMTGMAFVAHPPLSCRTSPPQGGRFAGGADILPYQRRACPARRSMDAAPPLHRISPLEGEMSGRTEGGIFPSGRTGVAWTLGAALC